MLLKNTRLNHLRVLSFHLFGTLLMLIALFYLHFSTDAVLVFLVIWVVYSLPVVILHIRYLNLNKEVEYEVYSNKIVQRKSGEVKVITTTEIKKIIIYMAPNKRNSNGIQLLPFESYYYMKVVLKNGESLIITCLLVSNLKLFMSTIQGVYYQHTRKLFCYPN